MEPVVKISERIDPERLNRVAEILKTLAHPVRLSIVESLQESRELTVKELQEITNIDQSLVSHHLIKMKDKGILHSERVGKNIYYSLVDQHITKIFSCMEDCTLL